MKREEIDQLLAEYVNGEISPADKEYLEELFKQDQKLKEEADEMLAIWQSLDKIEPHEKPGPDMDAQFYAMLQDAKAGQQSVAVPVSLLHRTWLKAAAAIIACITTFGIGRFTSSPVTVFKYKTVYLKQPVIHQPPVIKPVPVPLIASTPHKRLKKKGINDGVNSALAQQLRSVYASERIAAVTQLTKNTSLNNADLEMLELALKEDPNPNVRLTILDALRPWSARKEVQQVLISSLNHQDDELVKTSIVDMLIDSKSKRAIPQMIALLDDKSTNPIMQNKIKAGIENLLY